MTPNQRRLLNLARALDRALAGMERTAIGRLTTALRASERALERELRHLYDAGLVDVRGATATFREARARALLAQVRTSLDITRDPGNNSVMLALVRDSYAAGMDNAISMLSAMQAQTVFASASVPIEAAVQAANASARLAHHGQAFALKAEQLVIDGIIRGRGWGATARELRRETGVTASKARQIVRTESITASHAARTAAFERDGIEIATWVATMDDRVCGYCAARSGNIYKIHDIIIPAHPGCRCVATPIRPEWVEAGIVDLEWNEEHHRETLERMEDKERRGPSPFERALGWENPPEPVSLSA